MAAAAGNPAVRKPPENASAMSGAIGSARPAGSARCHARARRQLSRRRPRRGGKWWHIPAMAQFTSSRDPPAAQRPSM
eukprot:3983071-Pyramimonas_sp.AAC.1